MILISELVLNVIDWVLCQSFEASNLPSGKDTVMLRISLFKTIASVVASNAFRALGLRGRRKTKVSAPPGRAPSMES